MLFEFAKGGSSKSPVQTPDSLNSKDTFEVLIGLCEGPVKGLVEGPKSFYANGTPLLNPDGSPNFTNFELAFWPGDELGHSVLPALGGFSNPIQVGVELAQNVAVTRSGFTTGINAADFRMVIQSLVKSNSDGTFKLPLSLKFEIKRTDQSTWTPAWVAVSGSDPVNIPGPNGLAYHFSQMGGVFGSLLNQVFGNSGGVKTGTSVSYSFVGDRELFTSSTIPNFVAVDAESLCVDVVTHKLYKWNDGADRWDEAALTNFATYWTFVDQKGRTCKLFKESSTPPAGATGDYWISSPTALLVFNGTAWVFGNSSKANLGSSVSLVNGVWSIEEKVSSSTVKEIRVFLPEATVPYQFRVTKLSADSNTENSSVVQWESIQEITRKALTFNGVAMTKVLAQASDQFRSVPTFQQDVMGRVVKVPVNYDAVARTYTGVWNGTYKIEYTNNPAWVFLDFVENSTYGLSTTIPHVVNKWMVYDWAQYCDTPVPREDGTFRPRWTYNDYITEPRDRKELAQYIAGTGAARYDDDGNGSVVVLVDQDTPAVAIFTPENVGEDGFAYSYTEALSRANETTVEFINPALNWERDKRVIRDEDDITLNGRISDNFIAAGCTDVDEAKARARRRQITGLTEKETVTFLTNRKGRYLSAWEIILVADPTVGRGISGRISGVESSTSIRLRDSVTLDPGITYTATFDIVNPDYSPGNGESPFKTERRTVNSAAGTRTQLSFTTTLPPLAEYAAFTLEAEGYVGFPKPYRIINLAADDGSGENVQITALEVNRAKYAYIDLAQPAEVLDYSSFGNEIPEAPTNLRISSEVQQQGLASYRTLKVTWDRSSSKWVRAYKVYYSVDGVPTNVFETADTFITIQGPTSGKHAVSVTSIEIRGGESGPATTIHDLTGVVRVVAPPTSVRLIGGSSSTTFEDLSPSFAWTAAAPNPTFDHYELQVLTTANAVVRTENMGSSLTWTYDFLTNKVDGGGTARRAFQVQVVSVDQDGNRSVPATISVNNAAPAAPTIVTESVVGGVLVTLSTPTDRDVVGAYVWASGTSGFNPGTTTPTKKGNQQVFSIPTTTSVYIRAAYFDKFDESHTALTFSNQSALIGPRGVTNSELDTTPPAVPGIPTLTSTVRADADGTQLTKLLANWSGVTDIDLVGYQIELLQGTATTGTIFGPTAGTQYDWVVPSNVAFKARIRSMDRLGNLSAWTAYSTSHTATSDVGAPVTPASLVSTSGYAQYNLEWVNSSDLDLDAVEVWESATNTQSTAVKIATVPARRDGKGNFVRTGLATNVTRYVWIRSVDTSGNLSGFLPSTSAGVTASTISIPSTSITGPIGITEVAVLPNPSGYTGPKTIFLTTDQKIYRLSGGAWTKAVDGSDILADSITSNQLAAGSITAVELSANSVLASHLRIVGGRALNRDPFSKDINSWISSSPGLTVGAVTNGVLSDSELRHALTPGWGGGSVFDEMAIPIDRSKTYRFRGAYRRSSDANGVFYAVIDARGSDNLSIGGDGTFWYYPVAGVAPTTGWQTFDILFGANTPRPFPTTATYIRMGALTNYGGTTGWMGFQGFVVEEAIDGSLVVDGTIFAKHVAAATLTGDKMVADTITGREIRAGTIRADHMLIGVNDNLIPNPNSEESTTTVGVYTAGLGQAYNGTKVRRLVATPGAASAYYSVADDIPCAAGEQFLFECQAKVISGSTSTLCMTYEFKQSNGSLVYAGHYWGNAIKNDVTSSTSWVPLTLVAEAPANTVSVKIMIYLNSNAGLGVTAEGWIDAMSCRRMTKGSLIVNGSIKADKIDATDLIAKRVDVVNDGLRLVISPNDGYIFYAGPSTLPANEDNARMFVRDDGSAFFRGSLASGTDITLGTSVKWKLALQPADFYAADGEVVSFGVNLGATPSIDIIPSGLAPLAAGETYDLQTSNANGSGFTALLKIVTPGSTGEITLAGPGSAGTGGPNRVQARGSNNLSVSGNYTFNITGTWTFPVYPQTKGPSSTEARQQLKIWYKRSGIWYVLEEVTVYSSWEIGSSDNPQTRAWSYNYTAFVGNPVDEFGVSIGSTVDVISTSITSLSMNWTGVSGASSTRSATPAGQKAKFIVKPRNS